jgi:hypothetical protein
MGSAGGELMARFARHGEAFAEIGRDDLEDLRTATEELHSRFEAPRTSARGR